MAFAVGRDGFVFSSQYYGPSERMQFLPNPTVAKWRANALTAVLLGGHGIGKEQVCGRCTTLHVLNDAGWFTPDINQKTGRFA